MSSDPGGAPPYGGGGDGPDDTLDLALSDREQALASRSIHPSGGKAKDSTHALQEVAALPRGVTIGTDAVASLPPGLLDPVLAGAGECGEDDPAGILPPQCLSRLAAYGGDGPGVKAAKVGPRAWILSPVGNWPVYVRRRTLGVGGLARAEELLELSRIARRWGADRLCLSPQGDLDIFFNDRESFLLAGTALEELDAAGPPARPGRRGGPALLTRCRGLLFCPNAALDTLGAADRLLEAMAEGAPTARTPMSVSIHGCPAGCGFECGVHEYADLRIVGRRSRAPVADQELLALSPWLKALVRDCPAGALSSSGAPGRVLDLDEDACVKCGACLARDPSFRWPSPMGSYLTLELSGRRLSPPRAFLAPRILVGRTEDSQGLFRKIAELAALFRAGGRKNEILSDFMEREGLEGYFD